MRILRCLPVIALCLLPLSRADVRACLCDAAIPETLEARECGLCKEADKQPADMPPQQRAGYWSAAIAKARETWPNDPWAGKTGRREGRREGRRGQPDLRVFLEGRRGKTGGKTGTA
jgi:hypothetical protein